MIGKCFKKGNLYIRVIAPWPLDDADWEVLSICQSAEAFEIQTVPTTAERIAGMTRIPIKEFQQVAKAVMGTLILLVGAKERAGEETK